MAYVDMYINTHRKARERFLCEITYLREASASVARSINPGNARASENGMSNKYRPHVFYYQSKANERVRRHKQNQMPKIEKPTFITLYVQCTLYPFSAPSIPEQKIANSKWAVGETSKILKFELEHFPDIRVVQKYNGKVQLNIPSPELLCANNLTLWESIVTELQNSESVVYITIDVNNDTSEKIASNLADTVKYPWHTGYQGHHKETIIYHK